MIEASKSSLLVGPISIKAKHVITGIRPVVVAKEIVPCGMIRNVVFVISKLLSPVTFQDV